jgi:peptide/nickel transport system substrate-binding protein
MTGATGRPPRIGRRSALAGAAALGIAARGRQARAAPGKPAYGGTLIFADVQLIYSWQLQAAGRYNIGNGVNQVVDCLVYQLPANGGIVPWIAESYSVNDRATEFTFRLRDGVTFSDGTKLDATAVKANLDQAGYGDQAKGIPQNFDFQGYDRTEIVDDRTLKVFLKKPNRYFIIALSYPTAGLLAASTLEKSFTEQTKPQNIIGSGPFVFQSEIPRQEVTLVRREDYRWPPAGAANPGKAYLEKVVFREVAEDGLRTGVLQSGQAHVVKGIPPSDEEGLQAQDFLIHGQRPLLNVVDQISIRVDNKLVSERDVRFALSIGVNRAELVDTVLSKSYSPATGLLRRNSPGYVTFDKELAYDPDRANRLLDDAGWRRNRQGIREKNGQVLRLSVAASSQSSAVRPAMEFVGQQWRELGVVLINRAGDDTFMNQSAQSIEVPLRIFRPGLTSGLVGVFGYPNGFNANNTATLHSDPVLEDLFQQDLAEPDPAKQLALLTEIQRKLIVEYVYTIPLYEASQTYGANRRVRLAFNSNTLPVFQNTWIEPE